MRRLLLAFACLFVLAVAQNEWTVAHKRVMTLGTGLAFFNENDGVLAGTDDGIGTIVLQTTDGGQNFTRQNTTERDSFMVLDLAMSNPNNGVFSGVGLMNFACSAYTQDGEDWTETNEKHLFCAFQDVQTAGEDVFVLVGQWATIKNTQGDGIQISTDGGQQFVDINWNQGTLARYGSFLNSSFGFVSGGIWPETPASKLKSRLSGEYRLTEHISIADGRYYMHRPSHDQVEIPGYQAVVAKYVNGDWTTLFNLTGSIYCNGIWATDENNVWFTAEGINTTNNSPAAYVYHSNDGGQHWEIQLYLEEGSLMNIAMLDSTFGWAIGGVKNGRQLEGAFFQTTNGGATWTTYEIADVYPINISILSENLAYAIAFAPGSSTDLLRFGPSSTSGKTTV